MSSKFRFKKTLISAAMALTLFGSGFAQAESLPIETLKSIDAEALKTSDLRRYATISSSDVDHRTKAVSEAARMVGAQHGYNHHMKVLQDKIRANSDALDKIFDFRTLMTLASSNQNGKYLIPAILAESSGVKALSPDAKTITISERQYEIVRPARLTLRAPHWKSYLLGGSEMETNLPSELLLPKDDKERKSWEEGIEQGWVSGVNMAEREMITRMTRMKQDFNGIAKNIRLTMQKKLRQTLVTYDFEMSSGGGNSLSENKHVYRIAAPASLNGNVSDWKPIIMESTDTLFFPLEGGLYVDPMGRVQ